MTMVRDSDDDTIDEARAAASMLQSKQLISTNVVTKRKVRHLLLYTIEGAKMKMKTPIENIFERSKIPKIKSWKNR